MTPQDHNLSCELIRAEIDRNNKRLEELATERGLKAVQNVAATVGGVFLILPFFLLDFQDAASLDIKSVQTRNQYLSGLATERCAGHAPSTAPVTDGAPPAPVQ